MLRSLKTLLFFVLIILAAPSSGQNGFFSEHWKEKTIASPDHISQPKPLSLPDLSVEIDAADTLIRISPYIGGYDLNQYFGGKIYDKPALLEHIRNLELPFVRWPGGSGSNLTFWDRAKPDRPSDVVDYIEKGEVKTSIKWGDQPGIDYLSLDNYYRLRDSLSSQGMNVVNYSYARYGRSENPVGQAAHYAAEWVRYDKGRTLFWEIGNEHYGSWEAGYEIDTSHNQDGQPVRISGTLYAQHCKVFLDSMRAAAAETGSEIRVGAVISFSSNNDNWNKQVLNNLKNAPDFYILHKYYGNWENASAEQMLESIDQFYSDKAYIDGLLEQYCDPPVPLIESEWNTRYDGQNQNTTTANGLHTLLGFKGIINSGIGCSSRWNLIWNYNSGRTHGLISSENDNVTNEGLPAYSPRAPYYYIHYFRKFLGDASLSSMVEGSADIDVFSTSFSSGQKGIVLLNKSNNEHTVAVNISNFSAGERYYWYEVSPKNNLPMSREILVNGHENTGYDAGGPSNYASIPAYSANTEGGISVSLGPWAAVFVLAEGNTSQAGQSHKLEFNVRGKRSQSEYALQNAVISINGQLLISNEMGTAELALAPGDYEYQIAAEGFITKSGRVSVTGEQVVKDTLNIKTFVACFELYYEEDNTPVQVASIKLDSLTMPYTDEAHSIFEGIEYGEHSLAIESEKFLLETTINIWSDSTYILELQKPVYKLSIHTSEKYSMRDLSAVSITIDQESRITDMNGNASFYLNLGNYTLTCLREGYKTFSGEIALESDSTAVIVLKALVADVKFRLAREGTPVKDAEVIIGELSGRTNSLGLYIFKDLETEMTYSYTISREAYEDASGSFALFTDTTISVEMLETSIYTERSATINIYPNPASDQLRIESTKGISELRLTDLGGGLIFQEQDQGMQTELMTGMLKEGVYIVTITDYEGSRYSVKLLIGQH